MLADQANDAKDERSIANRLDKAKPQNDDGDSDDKPLPTEIARSVRTRLLAALIPQHGNEPSKGAKIDVRSGSPITQSDAPQEARRATAVQRLTFHSSCSSRRRCVVASSVAACVVLCSLRCVNVCQSADTMIRPS